MNIERRHTDEKPGPAPPRSELAVALAACRGAFLGIGLFTGMSNVLMLTGSFFMLEIYDRVLPSRSVPTLVGLVIIAAGLYFAQGVLDLIRGRILGRVGTALDEALNARVFQTVVRLPLLMGGRNDGLQPLRDLDNVRAFLGSQGRSKKAPGPAPPRKERTLSRSRNGCRPSLRLPIRSGSFTTVSNTRALSASSSAVPIRPRMRLRMRSRAPCAI